MRTTAALQAVSGFAYRPKEHHEGGARRGESLEGRTETCLEAMDSSPPDLGVGTVGRELRKRDGEDGDISDLNRLAPGRGTSLPHERQHVKCEVPAVDEERDRPTLWERVCSEVGMVGRWADLEDTGSW